MKDEIQIGNGDRDRSSSCLRLYLIQGRNPCRCKIIVENR